MLEGLCNVAETTCGWGYVQHIVERSIIHLASSAGVTLLAMFVWVSIRERGYLWKLHGFSFYLVPSVLALLAVFLREPFDAEYVDPAYKSYIDFTMWATGITLANIGIYRLTPRLYEVWKVTNGRTTKTT